MIQARRERDAAWQRQQRNQKRSNLQAHPKDNQALPDLDQLVLEPDDDFSGFLMDLEHNYLDELLLGDADEDHDENVEVEDTQALPLVEPPEPNEAQFEVDIVAKTFLKGPAIRKKFRVRMHEKVLLTAASAGMLWMSDMCQDPLSASSAMKTLLRLCWKPHALRLHNARFFNKTRSADFLCSVCRYPFPCQFVDEEDADEEEARLHDDNAFEYEGPPDVEEARRQVPKEMGSDSSDSADEYHPSDFNSASDDSRSQSKLDVVAKSS
ncbi:hypothetical protein DVH05_005673 [Phytophthora capsici]|nr:hypothetical protein DVH05_005673 [Phytophthora capsici]